MDMPKINVKDPKVIIGGIAIIIIIYVLYKRHQSAGTSASAGTATTAGQDSGIPLTDPNATDPGGSTGSGGGGTGSGAGPGPDLSGYESASAEQSDIGGITTQLAGIEGQIPGDVAAALAAAGFVPPTSTSGGATGGAGGPDLTGPLGVGGLNLPVAAQIGLVRAGIASPSQLGKNAANVYAHGGNALAKPGTSKPNAATQRAISAAVGKALAAAEHNKAAAGHSSHAAGNGAHGQRHHSPPPRNVPTPHAPPPHNKPAKPRPSQRRK